MLFAQKFAEMVDRPGVRDVGARHREVVDPAPGLGLLLSSHPLDPASPIYIDRHKVTPLAGPKCSQVPHLHLAAAGQRRSCHYPAAALPQLPLRCWQGVQTRGQSAGAVQQPWWRLPSPAPQAPCAAGVHAPSAQTRVRLANRKQELEL